LRRGVAGVDVEYVEIEKLKPNKQNPRRITVRQQKNLQKSIEKFGFVDPLIVNSHPGRENVVIGGHQRLEVAKKMGIKKVPVVYVDLTEDQERELNLRLNKNQGEWDWPLLAEFSEELLKEVGFEKAELEKVFPPVLELEEYKWVEDKKKITITYPETKHDEVLELVKDIARKIKGVHYHIG
jgi:hypothetical protein